MKKIVFLAGATLWVSSSLAIVNGRDGSAFTFVGQMNGASAVVVAPHWAMTARHVGGGVLKLNGISYTPDRILKFDGTGFTPISDIVLCHFTHQFTDFAYPYYGNIVGQKFAMVGYGENGILRQNGTGYDLDPHSFGPRRVGYNVASQVTQVQLPWISGAPVWTILYDLDGNGQDYFHDGGPLLDSNGQSIEATLGGGDSGGGFFIQINGQWRTIGLCDFVFDGNNNHNSYDFGDGGGGVAISGYAAFIESVINPHKKH